jgi:hypothetical protein
MTSVGENNFYMHIGNGPLLDRVGTSTVGDRTDNGYLN